jgi:hypothetical protein
MASTSASLTKMKEFALDSPLSSSLHLKNSYVLDSYGRAIREQK